MAKKLFELCVLEHLSKAVKSKEVWVEGSFKFRDPDQDLPPDWSERRVEYYQKHDIETDAKKAVATLRRRMTEGLQHLNEYLGRMGKRDVYVYFPCKGAKRAFWRVPKIRKRAERPIIGKLKEEVLKNWGTLDLLDMLLEADRRVGFSQFFQSSAQRQVLSEEEVRYRVNLVIFGLATGMGLRRVHTAVDAPFKYDSVLYFLSRYVTVEVLRELNTALANVVLRLRKRKVWGRTTACASDGKLLGAWDQNLVADWLPHRMKEGVYAYWHVDTNSLCVFGQVTSGPPRSAELAAMIRGLVENDTAMCIESNAVDSHGQSEGTWPFCHLMGVELQPRLKRLKYERVYLPGKELAKEVPNLAGVIARAIRWDQIEEQYDEIVKHVVAVKEGTGPVESILRRFSTSNRTSRVYKAGLEMGKALKTIFLCKVLSDPRLRVEIHDALNIVESWNSCIQFISYGRRIELPTNDPTMQELIMLCIMLQQNALVMVNTLLLDQVIEEKGLLSRMTAADKRALTPLFTSNVNPYGDFSIDLAKPSILERRRPAAPRSNSPVTRRH